MNAGAWVVPTSLSTPLRDGTVLAGDHYRSGQNNGRGIVLVRTPYDRREYRAQAEAWQAQGHDVLVQDVRGRYGSTGTWLPYASEGPDGAETARFLERENLLNGALILAGASYDAHCALEAARCLEFEAHRVQAAAVIAMVPALGLFETARNPDGTARLRDRIGWWHMHGFTAESRQPLAIAELERRCQEAKTRGVHSAMPAGIYGEHAPGQWERLWTAPKLDLGARYGSCKAPLLVVSGHRDFFAREALELADAWAAGNTGFLTGPWGHRLAADLDHGTAATLRRHGGLMAQIQEFLADARRRPFAREFTENLNGTHSWEPADPTRPRAAATPPAPPECEGSL
ncbi:CocE/NonD family hydrolase [Paeniglutamicibacter sp. NPDC012692]|uniref:CocE/NonD family hydrolase n=1 Tax=Paeniglutamicibacter sp. NPDC012692 TaxID=3364388 RepID=UPI003681C292